MKVLLTTDGSQRSLDALPHAAALARATGSALIFLRVLDPWMDLHKQVALTVNEAAERLTAEWEAGLAAILRDAGLEGEPLVVRKVRREDTRDTILRAASDHGASLIAMDSRGAGAMRHALVGSVAMGVIGKTGLPVMLTGPGIQAPVEQSGYTIVATTDGSPASFAVVRAIRPLVESAAVDVTLLRLHWPGEEPDARETAGQLRSLRSQLPPSAKITEVAREMAMVEGMASAVLAVSYELGASAIAMATHGHRAAYHLFGGSTALGVLSLSPIPVILSRSAPPT